MARSWRTKILLSAMLAVLAGMLLSACWQWGGRPGGDASSLQGKPAPEVSLAMLDGQRFDLAAQRGNVVLLDFWATWCPPCRLSLPHVQQLSGDTSRLARGLKVFAVNSQEDKDTIQRFVNDSKYTFAVPMDSDGGAMSKYLVDNIPATVIVGRDGKVANVFIGYDEGVGDDIDKAIDAALNAK